MTSLAFLCHGVGRVEDGDIMSNVGKLTRWAGSSCVYQETQRRVCTLLTAVMSLFHVNGTEFLDTY